MSYDVFQSKIKSLINRVGGGLSVKFSTDAEKGQHYANCSDGTTIIGCNGSLKLTVRWGSGHTAQAMI